MSSRIFFHVIYHMEYTSAKHSSTYHKYHKFMSKRQRTSSTFSKKSKSMFKPKSGKKKTGRIVGRSSLTPVQQQKLLGVEHKYRDYARTDTAIQYAAGSVGLHLNPNVPLATPFGGVARGDDSTNRDGRQIFVDELHIEGFIRFNGGEGIADPPDGQIVTLLLYQDTQTNAAIAATEDVVTNPSGVASGGPCFIRNPNGFERFNTLTRVCIARPPAPITQLAANNFTAGSVSVPFTIYKKFKTPIQIRYDSSSSGDVNDIMDNSFQLLGTIGGDTPVLAYGASITYNARMRFYG